MAYDYQQARRIISKSVSEAQKYMVDPADNQEHDAEDSPSLEIQREKASVGRWVVFFETTAPAVFHTEETSKFTFAKGFFTLSSDGTDDTPLQDWEVLGMIEFAKREGLLG